MYVSLTFDVEDYTTPEEFGIDDIPKWQAEIMSEEGVMGTFLVIGSKARSFRERGRKDVIEAMAKHEIGLHTNFGSQHPTVCELVQDMSFTEGMEALAERERAGINDLEEIFGKEVAVCSTHGGTQSTSYYRLAALWDKPWVYSAAECMPRGISWFLGGLHFADWLTMLEGYYPDPARVEAQLARWERLISDMVTRKVYWTSAFLGHPLMVKCLQFNDALNFPDGKNLIELTGEVRVPEMRTDEEVERARVGFRRVVQWLRDHQDLEVLPVAEVARRFGRRRTEATTSELLDAARRAVASQGRMTLLGTISIAQAMLGWAKMLLQKPVSSGQVEVGEPLGPLAEPPRACAAGELGEEQVKPLARELVGHVEETGHIPHALIVGSIELAAGALYHVLAEAFLASRNGHLSTGIKLRHSYAPYPPEARALDREVRGAYMGWPIHDVNMRTDNLARDFRLQSYTLRDVFPEGT